MVSAGFFIGEIWLEEHFRATGNVRNDSDDVSVKELVDRIDPPIRTSNHLDLIVDVASAVKSYVMR